MYIYVYKYNFGVLGIATYIVCMMCSCLYIPIKNINPVRRKYTHLKIWIHKPAPQTFLLGICLWVCKFDEFCFNFIACHRILCTFWGKKISEINRKVKKGMNYKIRNSSAFQIFALGIITDTPDSGTLREFIW